MQIASKTFCILDVFAMEKFWGNGLAVFRDAGDLSDEEMQAIAREMNQAETIFILSDLERNGGYEIGRSSLLFIKAAEEGDRINVQVGGRCIPLAQGQTDNNVYRHLFFNNVTCSHLFYEVR